MNMISFANFDNFDKQTSFFPEAESDDKTEDFSSILGNIFSTMQTTELPVKTDAPETIKSDSTISLEIPSSQNLSLDKTQSDNKVPELPEVEPKILNPTNSEPVEQAPQVPTLWAGFPSTDSMAANALKSKFDLLRKAKEQNNESSPVETPSRTLWSEPQSPIRHWSSKFKSEFNPIAKAKAEANQLFQAEANPEDDALIRLEEFAPPEDIQKEPVTIDLNGLPQINQGDDDPRTVNNNISAQTVEDSQPVKSDGSSQLFQAETAPIRRNDRRAETFINIKKEVSDKQLTDLPTIPIIEWTDKQQKEMPTIPIIEWNDKQTKEMPTIPIIQWNEKQTKEMPTIPIIEWNDKPTKEMPTIPIIEWNDTFIKGKVNYSAVNNQANLNNAAVVSEDAPTDFGVKEANEGELDFPQISLKPQIEDNKLKGFKITPNEVNSILKTFDKFLKNSAQQNNVSTSLNAEVKTENTGTFQEISQSIKDSFESIMKDSGSTPRIKNADPYQSPDIWWHGQNTTGNTENFPVEAAPQNLSLNSINDTSTDFPTETQVKLNDVQDDVPVNYPQAPVNFTNKPKAVETSKSGDFDIERISANQKSDSFTFEPTKAEIKPEQPKTEIKTEQPKAEADNNNFNIAAKFDKFLENVSKQQTSVETTRQSSVEPAKVFEQVNPHLIELAAMTAKKNEKQTLKMRLHPAELGSVEIKLEKNSAGTLNAYFRTETDGAKQALTQNLEQLRDSLQNAGWQIGQMEITNGSSSSTAGQHRQNDPRQSESVENYNFSRSSDKPDDLEQNSSNRLLSLLA